MLYIQPVSNSLIKSLPNPAEQQSPLTSITVLVPDIKRIVIGVPPQLTILWRSRLASWNLNVAGNFLPCTAVPVQQDAEVGVKDRSPTLGLLGHQHYRRYQCCRLARQHYQQHFWYKLGIGQVDRKFCNLKLCSCWFLTSNTAVLNFDDGHAYASRGVQQFVGCYQSSKCRRLDLAGFDSQRRCKPVCPQRFRRLALHQSVVQTDRAKCRPLAAVPGPGRQCTCVSIAD